MGGKGSGGARPVRRPDDTKRGRPGSYWRGTIGTEARAALAVMAIQDAVRDGVEQDEAEVRLIVRLILTERDARLG